MSLGAPIPWELQIPRDRPLLALLKLLTVTRQSPEAREADKRDVFDAEAWAFVHFLMFGDEGARADKLTAYVKLVSTGTDAAKAFAESFGPVETIEGPFRVYFQRSIFSYRRINLDVSVERERFPIRPLPPAESASVRALFHAAMRRPVESRAAIAEARKADAKVPGSYVAEGLLADQDGKVDEGEGWVQESFGARLDERVGALPARAADLAAQRFPRGLYRDRAGTDQGRR